MFREIREDLHDAHHRKIGIKDGYLALISVSRIL